MSLNKADLVSALIAIFKNEQTEETNADASVNRIANKMADAIDSFVRSGTVNVDVKTTGSASAQAGTGTGKVT